MVRDAASCCSVLSSHTQGQAAPSFLLQEESDGEIMTLEAGECDSPCWCDDTRSPGST